jgi:hypothetical protein
MVTDSDILHDAQAHEILDTDAFYLARPTLGVNGDMFISGADMKAILGFRAPVIAHCAANATEQINLGNIIAGFNYVVLDCFFKRGTTRARKQLLEVFQFGGDVNIVEHPFSTVPKTDEETIGISFAVNIVSGNVVLSVFVDDSDSNEVVFNRTILNNG